MVIFDDIFVEKIVNLIKALVTGKTLIFLIVIKQDISKYQAFCLSLILACCYEGNLSKLWH